MKTYSFPVATHSYFRITNQEAARQAFLASDQDQPEFTYDSQFRESVVQRRLARVDGDSSAYTTLDLVLAGARLKDAPTPQNIAAFRLKNSQLFGEPKKEYVDAILLRTKRAVTQKTAVYWDYIQAAVGEPQDAAHHDGPDIEVFLNLKHYLADYMKDFEATPKAELVDLLTEALSVTGLKERGWQVEVQADATHARVDHQRKRVLIGAEYTPRTSKSAMRIVVHEVYGHALRGQRDSVADGEGVAILLEQLLADRYKFRRSYRYIAAALGWGVEQHPMTFREVYEILWRMMVIMSRYSPDVAKRHAFDECARVYRGGRPEIAGTVYLKDSVYFTANLAIWQYLAQADLKYNEFVDLIEGRRGVLS
jgi:hypothetical protein